MTSFLLLLLLAGLELNKHAQTSKTPIPISRSRYSRLLLTIGDCKIKLSCSELLLMNYNTHSLAVLRVKEVSKPHLSAAKQSTRQPSYILSFNFLVVSRYKEPKIPSELLHTKLGQIYFVWHNDCPATQVGIYLLCGTTAAELNNPAVSLMHATGVAHIFQRQRRTMLKI